jgi:hypothetical protein
MCTSIFITYAVCAGCSKACAMKGPEFRPCGENCAAPSVKVIKRECCCSNECCGAVVANFYAAYDQRVNEQMTWARNNSGAARTMQGYPRLDAAYQTIITWFDDARQQAYKLFIDEQIHHTKCSEIRNEPLPSN